MIRDSFVETFGENNAKAVENAAHQHANGKNNAKMGSDPFKWALLICIGYECVDKYREHHGISAKATDIKKWVKKHADLGSHDGDCDYLALMAGTYDSWIKGKPKQLGA